MLKDPDGDDGPLSLGIENYLLVYYRSIIEAARASGTDEESKGSLNYRLLEFPFKISIPLELVES